MTWHQSKPISREFQLTQRPDRNAIYNLANAVRFLVLARLSREAALLATYARLSKNISGSGGGGALTSNPWTSAANSANSGGIVDMILAQLAAGSSPSTVMIKKSPTGVFCTIDLS